jgi:GNAT superfamily N-acetyltransferase
MQPSHSALPDYLPGQLSLEPGGPSDYFALERFHYRPRRPRTWCRVWTVRFRPTGAFASRSSDGESGESAGRIVAVGVLSWPVPTVNVRDRLFDMVGADYGRRCRFANDNIRTIARVIVHPQFRALGLAGALVRRLCETCPTRYVEAMAMMGRAHPFFEKAGMRAIAPADEDNPIYYLFDRNMFPAKL